MSNYADAALPARAGGALNDDLYISAQESQEVHKPLGGKSGESGLHQARNLWLVNLQDAGGAGLGEAAGANRFGDANGEISFGEALFWLRPADIGEYIAATFLHVDVSMHCLFSSLMLQPSGMFFRGMPEANLNQIDLRFGGPNSSL